MNNRGRFLNSNFSQTSFSDHHYIAVTIATTHNTSYLKVWCFNNRFLQDKSFVSYSTQFWGECRERKSQY